METFTPIATKERIKKAMDNAQQAFWAEVAKSFPEATTEDFLPDACISFDIACFDAIKWWTIYNVEEGDVPAEHCQMEL